MNRDDADREYERASRTPRRALDIRVENHGTLCLLRPKTVPAAEWLAHNLDPEVLRFGEAYVVEPRYADAIVAGAREAGLEVQG